jgi:hypothetical protein
MLMQCTVQHALEIAWYSHCPLKSNRKPYALILPQNFLEASNSSCGLPVVCTLGMVMLMWMLMKNYFVMLVL